MRDTLFHLDRTPTISIQAQIREMIVSAILSGQLPRGSALPSCRRMSQQLKVSRNTVVLAYQGLVDDGYLTARERSGFYVSREILEGRVPPGRRAPPPQTEDESAAAPDWEDLYRISPTRQNKIEKPDSWQEHKYPFIYGQLDEALFPIAAWRECTRQSLGRRGMGVWTSDRLGQDDPMLIEQIRTRLLPRRGISASEDEILITLGAQNALYLIASLLIKPGDVFALGDPGFADVRNIARLKTDAIRPISVDDGGLIVDERMAGARYIYVTPSHHFPTTATMPLSRRAALLRLAAETDAIVIEDDYEPEANYVSEPTPALKSLDRSDRVLYVGSLSKTMFPGLRLGYVVAPAPVIAELRALRQLMMRHAPTNNQRTTALFLALGHHDTMVHRLNRVYRARWEKMRDAIAEHLPGSSRAPSFGGTSYWVEGRAELDAEALAAAALEEGVVIEPGGVLFDSYPDAPKNYFRLGFSSIPEDRIAPGIEILARLIDEQLGL